MEARMISCVLIIFSLSVCQLSANYSERPSDEEIEKYIKGMLPDERQEILVAKWIINNRSEVLPLLFEIEVNIDKNPLAVSAKYGAIQSCATKENAQSIIDRLLEPGTSDVSKTSALKIAEKFGMQDEKYRGIAIELLSSTKLDGVQKNLLKLLQTYGREEDAELVLEIFKNSEVRNIKPVASDTLLAIGGPEIIEPWEEELARLREAEPERLRKQKEKIERLSEQEGITFGPMPEGPSWLDYIEKDLQSLKEKVAAQEAGHTQEENPKSSSQGGGEEGDEVRASSTAGQSDAGSKSARPWRSFTIVLAGMIALAALIALARKRKA